MIGILGAAGDVGAAVVRALQRLDAGPLRGGGRHQAPDTASMSWQRVDIHDAMSLRQFVEGCRVVINCAGPTDEISAKAGQSCLDADIGYVDVSGDAALLAKLGVHAKHASALICAGLQPGLTTLLPRWAASQGYSRIDAMTAYFGLRDRFTPTAAVDYLCSAHEDGGISLAAWRGGVQRGTLRRRAGIAVPYFPAPATAVPYLAGETQRLAAELGIPRVDWYNVFTGRHMMAALDTVSSQARVDAAAALCLASRLDLDGRVPFVTLLTQFDGVSPKGSLTRTLLMRGSGNAALTGALAAVAAFAVVGGEIPLGCYTAAMALTPSTAVERLRRTGAMLALELLDVPINTLHSAEEGCL